MGVAGFIGNIEQEVYPKDTITIDMFANTFFRNYYYSADDNILVLLDRESIPPKAKLFIVSLINKKLSEDFSYSNQYRMDNFSKTKIQLPTKNAKIDFEFMDSFINKLEAERMAKLEAYLLATGLKDYELTEAEKKAIAEYDNFEWCEFKLGTLFERIETKKLPFKADELPKEQTANYTLPCLTSSFKNQGLNYFAPKDGATILKNMISIPSNSDVYRAYFQSNEFTVLSDAYAIRWIFSDVELLPNQYLFTVPCINKVTDLSIYSYKNKLGGWNVVKDKLIQLPIKNDQPDYAIMDTLISAIKKLVIKDVVLYTQAKTLSSDSDYANNDSYKDSDQLCLL